MTSETQTLRKCVGCNKAAAKAELLQFQVTEGRAAHTRRSARGRSAYVHPTPACLAQAVRMGFSRSFKCALDTSEFATSLKTSLQSALAERVCGARRAGAACSLSDPDLLLVESGTTGPLGIRQGKFAKDVLRIRAELAGAEAFVLRQSTCVDGVRSLRNRRSEVR